MRQRAADLPSTATSGLIAIAVIGAAALLAYHGSFAVPFFFDDTQAIVANPTIRDLGRIGDVLSPPAGGGGMAGRPLVNLSLAFNYALGGLDPRGYHALNLALHVAAALLLFGLVRRTLLRPGLAWRVRADAFSLALAAALLWALHPLQTESVTCVIQRTELLVAVFYLLTLYAFVRSLEAPAAARWRAVSLGACALGMASKEVMVSAPLLVLLYDRTFVAGTFHAAWRRRRGFYAALGSSWLVLIGLLVQMGGTRGTAAGLGLGVPWWAYALRQCEAIPAYLGLSFWPYPLVLDYGTNLVASPWHAVPGGLLLLALAGLTGLALQRWPAVGFLGFWFFAILAPSSSVIPLITQTMAEHRMYLPLAAIVLAAVLVIHRLMGARGKFALAAIAVAFGGITAGRNALMQSELRIWEDTVAKRPDNPRALASYAVALSNHGRPGEALPFLARARALDPTSSITEQNLGTVHFELRHFAEAVTHFRRALELDPRNTIALSNLGATLFELGDVNGALACYQSALALAPDHIAAHRNAGRARFALGQFAEAAKHYAEVARQLPAAADAHYDLGLALARSGDMGRALPHFEAAMRLKPDPAAHLNYARFLAGAGYVAEARASLEAALRLKPDFAEARQELERLRTLPSSSAVR